MTYRRSLDSHPGSLPEIRSVGSSVKFFIDVRTVRRSPRLVLRCDDDGNVWASIVASNRNEAPAGAEP
jgi:hypothetical protein